MCVRGPIERIHQQTLVYVNVSALPPVGSSAEDRPSMQSTENESVINPDHIHWAAFEKYLLGKVSALEEMITSHRKCHMNV